jgi:bile acid-coenzyme A ligase
VAPEVLGHIRFRDPRGHRDTGPHSEDGDERWEGVGDMGWLDRDGYLYLADRASDMIRTASGLIAPLPIEGAIEFHPSVRSALVVGVEGDDGRASVHAVVDAPDGLDAPALERMLAERFPDVRVPDSWSWWDGPLRDNAGKAQRGRIRDAVRSRAPNPAVTDRI